ncbi:sensor histidine kinase [Granulicella sp. S156]|uniref:sensor histidine kinase n=1 Tax=Granulicella sp. S156 TaxID=1747224 RepID=UPI00131E4F88|nr:sensor histidine kinase [Granulicella sp. S156]
MVRRFALVAVCLGAWCALPAWPQVAPESTQALPAQQQFEYTRTLWRISDGLPEDTVQAIVESSGGVLWIGTTGGLTRFDGSHMEVPARAQPLLANSIFTLTFGRDGSLWAGTEGGGLLRLRNGLVKAYSFSEGLTDGFVRKVFEDSRGRLWVGTDDGLFVMDAASTGERLRRVDVGAIAPQAVHSITEDKTGRIWVGGSRLIALDPDGTEREFALPGAYSQNRVKSVLETRDGRLWVGTVGGLQYLEKGKFHTVSGIRATVRTLLESSDGTLWIGTIGDGVWTLHTESGHSDTLRRISGQGLLPSETVLYLFEDDQRQIWIGTQAGLVRLNKTPVRVVALPESGDPDFGTISGDEHGDVWVAAQNLYLIRKNVARRVTYGGLTNIKVRNVYRARDGALWIGTDGSGAYRVDGDEVRHYTAPAELTNNFIRGFLESRDGVMWIATDEGVSRIGADGAKKFTEANGLAFFSTRSLLQDSGGSLWIGTDHGLSRWTGGGFEQDVATVALARDQVWSILEDRSGALWFGTRDHGLFRYRAGQGIAKGSLQQFTVSEGLPSNSVYQVLQDRTGRFWVTGPNTIASVAETEMERASSAGQPLSVQTYRMPFGADGAQMYGGRQPAGYLAPDDSVWFPTSRGAAHLARVETAAEPAPRASVDEVIEDGQSVAPHGPLKVAANVVRLSFAFTVISLRPQEGVRFRYKLEGFDANWNAAGASREATYTNLRAGSYRFRVRAFNTANPESVSEFDLVLVKAQVFYETWWFYALCCVTVLAIAWSLYQVRVRGMRTRFTAVLEERSRLAREMHDTVIQGCAGISALLEAMASTQELKAGSDQLATKDGLLEVARVQARATIDEARQAIWNMRHEPEKDVDLIAALKGVAAQTTRESESGEAGTVVAFEHDVERMVVGASVAHEILMTVREAVYNSVQHSRSGRVEMQLKMRGDELVIGIEDKGCGFATDREHVTAEGHYGIVGMRERVQRLGGRMELTSARGVGTRVQLRLRVRGDSR